MVRVVIVGATGRMGRTLVACARQMPGVVIVGAVDRGDNPSIGRDVGELAGIGPIGVQVVGELASALADGAADVIVDFSDPASTAAGWIPISKALARSASAWPGPATPFACAAGNSAARKSCWTKPASRPPKTS